MSAESTNIEPVAPRLEWFTHQEVVTALLKDKNIHAGIWMLSAQFGLAGVTMQGGDGNEHPTALVPLMRVGIQETDQLSNLSVDAAVVNPA